MKDYDDLYNALDRYKVGDEVELKVLRDGKKRRLKVALVNIY